MAAMVPGIEKKNECITNLTYKKVKDIKVAYMQQFQSPTPWTKEKEIKLPEPFSTPRLKMDQSYWSLPCMNSVTSVTYFSYFKFCAILNSAYYYSRALNRFLSNR